MELSQCIFNRRSIRKYLARKVSPELILKIIEAARWAPSGGNLQPWEFIVISNRKLIVNIKKAVLLAAKKKFSPDSLRLQRQLKYGLFFNAPVLIGVAVDLTEALQKKENVVDKLTDSTEIISTGAAIQNILLMAHSLGLGTCWCRADSFKREILEKKFKIKKTHHLVAIIALGYPAENPTANRKKIPKIMRFVD